EQLHQGAEAQAALGIAAVGIEHHDLAAVLLTRAVEIDADRVVQCRLSAGCQIADTLDETREVALSVTTASYLTREVDERHIDGVWERRQEFDDCLLRESEIELLASTDVEENSDVEWGSGLGS